MAHLAGHFAALLGQPCQILHIHDTVGELLLPKAHRRVILGHDDHAGRAFVQPVNDVWPLLSADPIQLWTEVQNGICEGA